MKTERRHELQTNSLALWLEHQIEWCKQNAAMLAGVIGGVCLVVAGYVFLQNRAEQNALASWTEFFTATGRLDTVALESLSTRESGTPPGQMADLLLADTALDNGIDLMTSDRGAAEEQLNKAKNRYDGVRKSASDPLLLQRATLGMARYYETVGLLEDAIREYERLVKDYPNGPYTGRARRQIDYLKQPSTQAFVGWYREHKPLPPQSPGFGMLNPDDLHSLPPNEKSFPPRASGGAAP